MHHFHRAPPTSQHARWHQTRPPLHRVRVMAKLETVSHSGLRARSLPVAATTTSDFVGKCSDKCNAVSMLLPCMQKSRSLFSWTTGHDVGNVTMLHSLVAITSDQSHDFIVSIDRIASVAPLSDISPSLTNSSESSAFSRVAWNVSDLIL